jgi:hypothetical protein
MGSWEESFLFRLPPWTQTIGAVFTSDSRMRIQIPLALAPCCL